MSKKELLKFVAFLLLISVAINLHIVPAAIAGGCGGGGGGGGGCPGGNVIDPPPGEPFQDPVEMPNLSPIPGIFEGNLEAKIASINVGGKWANLLTYNGYYPGPTIRVSKGEILRLHFKNALPYTTEKNILGFTKNVNNVHTHGWHVSPEEPADAAHLQIKPGETYDYEYDLSLQEAGTLSFYHPHVHGLTAEQYWGGLFGCLVTEDELDVLKAFETHIVAIKDITLVDSNPEPYTSTMDYMHGKEGNTVMVNGKVNPVLSIRPGQVQRLRILNACNARHLKISLENHVMYLVGTDGGLLDKPYALSEILLTPGERIDVLVKATKTSGSYKLRSLPYDRGCGSMPQTVTLMTISYSGTPVSNIVPSKINPNAKRLSLDVSLLPKRRLELSMRHGRAFINGMDFDVNPYTIMSEVGTYEVWEIVNLSGMDHPFHQHVNPCQILSINGGDPSYALYKTIPAWKDTTYIPRWGSVTFIVPIMDYMGMTMFHCHIVEHEDIGMMGIWHIM